MWSLKCDFLKSGGKTLEKHKKVTESGGKTSAFGQDFGRSGEAQTRGLRIPNGPMKEISAKNSFFRPFPPGKPRSSALPSPLFPSAPKR